MKRKVFRACIGLVLAGVLPSCGGNKGLMASRFDVETDGQTIQIDGRKKPARSLKEVTKDYQLGNFTGLENRIGLKVYYKQGRDYRVTVTTTPAMLAELVVEEKAGMLVFRRKETKKAFRGSVTVELTAPRLNAIDNHGALEFHADDFSADDFRIDSRGALEIETGTIACRSFVKSSSGASKLRINVKADGRVQIDGRGAEELYGTVEGKDFSMDHRGSVSCRLDVRSEIFNVVSRGSSSMTLDYRGGAAEIHNSGSGTVNLKVDCEKLIATNSGAASVAISGTADDTHIDAKGVSHIDTSRLNKF